MPTTDGVCFDCILRVSFFFSTFTTKAHNISPSIISAMNHLEAVDAFVEAFMTYACDGMMGHALEEGKQRKSYNWKGWNKEGKGQALVSHGRRARGPEMKKGQASLPVLLSPLNLLDAFAQLSLESLILRMEDSTMSPLT